MYYKFEISGLYCGTSAEQIPYSTDVAPPDVPKEVRSARLRTAMDHVTDFARSNPKIAQVQYQTNAGERGEKNHAIFQSKWGEAQKQHGIETPLVRVEKHPFR